MRYKFPFSNLPGRPSVIGDDGSGGLGTAIPLAMQNRDCVQFIADWKAGAEVLDADGKPLPYSDEEAQALGLEPV